MSHLTSPVQRVLGFLGVLMMLLLCLQTVPRAAVAADTPHGVDVSWPQCGKSLPRGQAFAVVGVNDGLANTTNPCLQSQIKWAHTATGKADADRVALYVNTGNPGFSGSGKTVTWPRGDTYAGHHVSVPTRYDSCKGRENYANLGCAYMYGWRLAYDDARHRGIVNPAKYRWWLDVEEVNTWNYDNQRQNAAVLEGMNDYLTKTLHARTGIYTVTSMWLEIVGSLDVASSLRKLDVWYALGKTDQATAAKANTLLVPPTDGRIIMVQYIQHGIDYNYAVPKKDRTRAINTDFFARLFGLPFPALINN